MIDPKLLTLAKLLEGRLFRIPQYQRAYSWTSRQRADLFSDLDSVARGGADGTHFMATMVVLDRSRVTILADEYHVVDVVDGQQRLTTLLLLLRAVSRALGDSRPHRKLAEQIDELLVKGDDVSLLLLQTNHDTSHLFVDYMREGRLPAEDAVPATLADTALRDGIAECEAYVARSNDPVALASLLRNRLSFILHTIQEERTVYTVFEVLNSRGLSVAWIDRLKSLLMAIAFEAGGNAQEHIGALHAIWHDVYRALGVREGMSDEALRFAAVLLTGEKSKGRLMSAAESADAVRRWCGNSPAKAIDASRWLVRVISSINKLYDRSVFSALTTISQARFLAVAIDCSEIAAANKQSCFAQWEKTVFRVYGLEGKDARTLSGQLVTIGLDLVNHGVDGKRTRERLAELTEQTVTSRIRDCLAGRDVYHGWSRYLRYMLYRYEEHLAREAGEAVDETTWTRIWAARADDTIEHVAPVSTADADGLTDTGLFVHRLGNLIILPPRINSSLKARPFAEKRGVYNDAPLRHVREVGAVPRWGKGAANERERRMIAWAEDTWGP
jgi:hypothetical protein